MQFSISDSSLTALSISGTFAMSQDERSTPPNRASRSPHRATTSPITTTPSNARTAEALVVDASPIAQAEYSSPYSGSQSSPPALQAAHAVHTAEIAMIRGVSTAWSRDTRTAAFEQFKRMNSEYREENRRLRAEIAELKEQNVMCSC